MRRKLSSREAMARLRSGYDASMIEAITGGSSRPSLDPGTPGIAHIQRADTMRRLLAFAGRSIDDVVNCPVARRDVISYYRIGHQMRRIAEVDALEHQWNPTRRR
jgi:hypothetical protein